MCRQVEGGACTYARAAYPVLSELTPPTSAVFPGEHGLSALPAPRLRMTHHHCVMVTAENEDTSTLTFPRTDAGNGELFAHLWQSQVLYDHDQEHWLT